MATVGELLKKARLEQQLEFSDIEKETKIKSEFIKALEEGDYEKLPSAIYARGFLKNYASFLGLETQKVLALFRREFDQNIDSKLLPSGLSRLPTRRKRITLMALLLIPLFIIFFSYLFFQYKGFLGSPSLKVSYPRENQEIEEDSVVVAGKTDPDVTLSINNQNIAVFQDGSFRDVILVLEGEFTITVVAKNRFGKESKIIRLVKVK